MVGRRWSPETLEQGLVRAQCSTRGACMQALSTPASTPPLVQLYTGGMCNIKSTLTLTLLFLIYAVPYCVMRFIVELNVHVYTPPLSPPTAVHTRRQYKRAVEVLRVLA